MPWPLGAARVDIHDRRLEKGRNGLQFPFGAVVFFGFGFVAEMVDDGEELASLDLLGHDVGGAGGADAGGSGGVDVVERDVPDGSAGGGVDVDGGVVFSAFVGKCHEFSGSCSELRHSLSL